MPPKLTIIRKRTSYAVNAEIEKLQKEISETAASINKYKTDLKQTKKNYQEEKNPKLKSEFKSKHEEGVKIYTELTAKAKELDQKMYGLQKEYSDLKAKEEEAALKAKKEAEAAAAATAREGDIVIETDVVDENGNSIPLAVNYDDDYEKVVEDFVSLYGLDEEDYDDLLDQVYEALSEDEEYYDDDDDDVYDDEYGYYYDDSEGEYEAEEYFEEFNTGFKDPKTGKEVTLKIYNTADFREEVAQFKAKYTVSDVKMLNELLLRMFSCFRYVEISTFEIDGDRTPLGLSSEDYEEVLGEYAEENGLDDATYERLLGECEDALTFYDDIEKSFTELRNNGEEINRGFAIKMELERISKEMQEEMMGIVTEGRRVKGVDQKRFEELSKLLQGRKKVFDEKKEEYGKLCERLNGLFETRKGIEKRFEEMKLRNKKYIPTL